MKMIKVDPNRKYWAFFKFRANSLYRSQLYFDAVKTFLKKQKDYPQYLIPGGVIRFLLEKIKKIQQKAK